MKKFIVCYHGAFKNEHGKNTGIEKFIVNGKEIPEKEIRLNGDEGIYEIEVEM